MTAMKEQPSARQIYGTIGPACADVETLEAMFRAGMTGIRLNLSHVTLAQAADQVDALHKAAQRCGKQAELLIDMQGPELRVGVLAEPMTLNEGEVLELGGKGIPLPEIAIPALLPGQEVLLDDGKLLLRVTEQTETGAVAEVLRGGVLRGRKSLALPGADLEPPTMTASDVENIRVAASCGVTGVMQPFVRSRRDLETVRRALDENGGAKIRLFAKIENQTGIDNIDEICECCEGIMIGRGDMGVEIPFEGLPAIQKRLITKCRLLGKRVITATEMLESMIHNARPTRAEISDVANAVYDGTSAVMLSGETAAGKYPVLAVATMARIAEHTEQNIHYAKRFARAEFRIRNTVDAISHATCGMAIDIDAKAIAVCTLSGMTARMVSRFRSPVDILGLTTNEKTYHKLALSWGVTPVMCDSYTSIDVLFYTALQLAKKTFSLTEGERIVITGGITNGRSGNTNIIKVETV